MRGFSVRLLTAMLFLSAGVRESPAQSATSVEDIVPASLPGTGQANTNYG